MPLKPQLWQRRRRRRVNEPGLSMPSRSTSFQTGSAVTNLLFAKPILISSGFHMAQIPGRSYNTTAPTIRRFTAPAFPLNITSYTKFSPWPARMTISVSSLPFTLATTSLLALDNPQNRQLATGHMTFRSFHGCCYDYQMWSAAVAEIPYSRINWDLIGRTQSKMTRKTLIKTYHSFLLLKAHSGEISSSKSRLIRSFTCTSFQRTDIKAKDSSEASDSTQSTVQPNSLTTTSQNPQNSTTHTHNHNHPPQTPPEATMAGHSHTHDHEHNHDNDHSHSHASLFGHTHTHSSADSVFSQEHGGLRNPAIRITWIGLLVNLAMAVSKGIGGVVFHSQSLIADAVHALSDLVSDFLTLATVTVAAKPPSKFFPNGYGKIETLGSLGVSALLLLAGISVGWSGLISVSQHFLGDTQLLSAVTSVLGHGHSHSHSHGGDSHGHDGHAHVHGVDLNAMWLALGSIGVKEWLYHATMKVANQTGSVVLVANAWHHRVDSLTAILAVGTIGSSYLFDLQWIDALGGILVSSVIIHAGYVSGKSAALELADCIQAVDSELLEAHKESIKSVLAEQVANSRGNPGGPYKIGDFEINKVALMPSGPNFVSEIELKTSATMSTGRSVATAHYVEENLPKTDKRLKRVIVNVIDKDTIGKLEKQKHA